MGFRQPLHILIWSRLDGECGCPCRRKEVTPFRSTSCGAVPHLVKCTKKSYSKKNFVPYFKFWSTKLSAPVEHPTSPARQHSHPSQRQCGLRPSKPFYFCWCGPVGNSSGNFALLCAAWYKKRGKRDEGFPLFIQGLPCLSKPYAKHKTQKWTYIAP